ncbi:MAG: acyltransferase, partial [Cytophagales bacterium]|nr:acyltransferase [Cytophaga sp.]
MKINYPSLNGLRAISILLVLLHHLSIQNQSLFGKTYDQKGNSLFIDFLQDGHMGVNIFFVISGFLITSLLLQEEQNTSTISLKQFYIKRTLRIFPAYYFLLIVYFFAQLLGYLKINNEAWFTAITFTKYFNWQEDWFTSHGWSLSIEEHFYLFWPLIFLAGDTLRKITCVLLIIAVLILRRYVYIVPWINDLTIFLRIDAIAIGCLCALYLKEIIKIISPWWNRIFYVSIAVLFYLEYCSTVHYKNFIFRSFGYTHGTFANIFIALIMLYSVFGPKGIWFKLLNTRVLNYIGLLSYSLYLWQQLFTYNSHFIISKFPMNIILMVLAALFSYYVIE